MADRPPKAKPEITVDIVVFTVEDKFLKVLLVRRADYPAKDSLSLPGGFLWQNETTAQSVKRVLKEKANVNNVFFEQLYTFDDLKRDPRGHIITVAHLALVPSEWLQPRNLSSGSVLVPVGEIKNLPFDHPKIIEYALKRLRSKLGYSNIAYSLLPKLFTLSQLQEIYEVILGHSVDRRNFRKKIQSLDIIELSGQKLTGQKHRPARLFRFKKPGYEELAESFF